MPSSSTTPATLEVNVIASSSAGNATLLNDPHAGSILLDAGVRFETIQEATGFKVSSLAGCLVTHEHGDHCRAVPKLAAKGVNVYATGGTIQAMPWSGPRVRRRRLRPVTLLEPFQVGGWNVVAFPAIHDAEDPCGFLLASETATVLYVTDTAYSEYRFSEAITHALIETNFSLEVLHQQLKARVIDDAQFRRVVRNHLSLERAIDLLKANDTSKLEAVYLLHLSDRNSDEDLFRKRVQEVVGCPVYVAAGRPTH